MTAPQPPPSLHVYTSRHQPATRWVAVLWLRRGKRIIEHRLWHRLRPRQLVRTSCCSKLRWAARCTVQVYYDMIPYWCRKGHGCKE